MNTPGKKPTKADWLKLHRKRKLDQSAATFRDNLHKLAERKSCPDENSLAKRLGWVREKKKWLRRLWKSGLVRPNAKTADDLDQLSKFFDLKDTGQFWNTSLFPPKREYHRLRLPQGSVDVPVRTYGEIETEKLLNEIEQEFENLGMQIVDLMAASLQRIKAKLMDTGEPQQD
ncbi:hypothetical protein GC163_12655 [bacterium]|nr:hypothetical protein [bacterium]